MQIMLDEGYQFGLGLFETIAVEENCPVFLERHLNRLKGSMTALHIGGEADSLKERIREYLQEHPMEYGALKVMISGENQILTSRQNPYGAEQFQKGFITDFSPVRRNETSPLTFHKTFNYGDCILEKRRAHEVGVDERIFLNTRGEICEGTVCNVFFAREEKLYTPVLSSGMLPGIMRGFVMETCHTEEIVLHPEEVKNYTECFVTNSLMGIMPVSRLGEWTFPGRSLAKRLMARYQEQVQKEICQWRQENQRDHSKTISSPRSSVWITR